MATNYIGWNAKYLLLKSSPNDLTPMVCAGTTLSEAASIGISSRSLEMYWGFCKPKYVNEVTAFSYSHKIACSATRQKVQMNPPVCYKGHSIRNPSDYLNRQLSHAITIRIKINIQHLQRRAPPIP